MMKKILILFLGMIFLAGFVLGDDGFTSTYGDVSVVGANTSVQGSGEIASHSSGYSWAIGIIVVVILVYLIYWMIQGNKFAQQKYSRKDKKKGVRKR